MMQDVHMVPNDLTNGHCDPGEGTGVTSQNLFPYPKVKIAITAELVTLTEDQWAKGGGWEGALSTPGSGCPEFNSWGGRCCESFWNFLRRAPEGKIL